MEYPQPTLAEIQAALDALKLDLKPQVRRLSNEVLSILIQNLDFKNVLSNSAMQIATNQIVTEASEQLALASLLVYYFSADIDNAKYFLTYALPEIVHNVHQQEAYGRLYSLLTLCQFLDHSDLLQQCIGVLENQSFTDSLLLTFNDPMYDLLYEVPLLLVGKYLVALQHSKLALSVASFQLVQQKQAEQLLEFAVRRFHATLGLLENSQNQSFSLNAILFSLQNMLQIDTFRVLAFSCHVASSIFSYISALFLLESLDNDILLKCLQIMENCFINELEGEDLKDEIIALCQIDFFGICTSLLQTAVEDVKKSVMRLLARCTLNVSVATAMLQHMRVGLSKLVVSVTEFILLLQEQVNDRSSLEYVMRITINLLVDPQVIEQYCGDAALLKGVAFMYENVALAIEGKDELQRTQAMDTLPLFAAFVMLLLRDTSLYVDYTKVNFHDFRQSGELAISYAGKLIVNNYYQLLIRVLQQLYKQQKQNIVVDTDTYQTLLAALLKVAHLRLALLPFIHQVATIELLRGKFRNAAAHKIPPLEKIDIEALQLILSYQRSVRYVANIPFALKLMCRLEVPAATVITDVTVEHLLDMMNWFGSEDVHFSQLGRSLVDTKAPYEEVDDAELVQQRTRVRQFMLDGIIEVLQLVATLAMKGCVNVHLIVQVFKVWEHITSTDLTTAETTVKFVNQVIGYLDNKQKKAVSGKSDQAIQSIFEAAKASANEESKDTKDE